VGMPTTMVVTDASSSTVLRHREAVYDDQSGDATTIKQFTDGINFAPTTLAYDANGNLAQETAPPSADFPASGYTLHYTYDPTVATYPVLVTDTKSYSSSMDYDFRFGKPILQVDENNHKITTAYDVFGRVVTIVGPFENVSDPGHQPITSNYTITFDYHPDAAVPYAHTRHFDGFRNPSGQDQLRPYSTRTA
jgi:hypothetical protein